MDDIKTQVIRNTENIIAMKDDIKEIKESIKEINKKLNGYLDKKIETKVITMAPYIESTANNAINKRLGKWLIGFALSLLTTFVFGILTGKYWR